MKIIFLDIDGVLNVEVYIKAFWDICSRIKLARPEANLLRMDILRDQYGNIFCTLATNRLEWIIEATGAKIVISSTLRMAGLQEMKNMWKDRNLPGEVIGITPTTRNRVNDVGFNERAERGHEIKRWLQENKGIESYVILDDDNDMLAEQIENFIQTDEVYGITLKDAEKAIEILNNG